jgi:hypothetical protein
MTAHYYIQHRRLRGSHICKGCGVQGQHLLVAERTEAGIVHSGPHRGELGKPTSVRLCPTCVAKLWDLWQGTHQDGTEREPAKEV